jgi:hypothetical protein
MLVLPTRLKNDNLNLILALEWGMQVNPSDPAHMYDSILFMALDPFSTRAAGYARIAPLDYKPWVEMGTHRQVCEDSFCRSWKTPPKRY